MRYARRQVAALCAVCRQTARLRRKPVFRPHWPFKTYSPSRDLFRAGAHDIALTAGGQMAAAVMRAQGDCAAKHHK